MTGGLTGSSACSAHTARSARRATVRATWQAAVAGLPPGMMKSLSGGRSSFRSCSAWSKPSTSSSFTSCPPGQDSSPPRLNSSCWVAASRSRTASGNACVSTTPICELSSSTSPIAQTRRWCLGTREPSVRPVVPVSPVRVAILLSRWPMGVVLDARRETAGKRSELARAVANPPVAQPHQA